jgi:hypothetical protein
MRQEKNCESVVWLIFFRFVGSSVALCPAKLSASFLFLLPFIELEFYPSGDNCIVAYTRL